MPLGIIFPGDCRRADFFYASKTLEAAGISVEEYTALTFPGCRSSRRARRCARGQCRLSIWSFSPQILSHFNRICTIEVTRDS